MGSERTGLDEPIMAEEKRSETICTKVGERMALDILRMAAVDDRSVSEYVYLVLRRQLYGDVVRMSNTVADTK